jgi:uncharacterized surface protein with fasciclin (FAS1) repeats
MFRKSIAALAVVAFIAVLSSPVADAKRPEGKLPIFPLAKQSGLNTLAKALQVADLVGTINSGGPYTVFAPTDDAFAALGEETLNAVLSDVELLRAILLYHVAPEALDATEVLSRSSIPMANGEEVTVDAAGVRVNDSNIIATDILAKNGIVHLIDAVLLPPSIQSQLGVSLQRSAAPGVATFSTTTTPTETRSWGAIKALYEE